MSLFLWVVILLACFPVGVLFLFLWLQKVKLNSRKKFEGEQPSWGFFHPYCNAGGGGERVLWAAVRAVQQKYPDHHCVVYTGDVDVRGEDILDNAEKRFNIKIQKSSVHFVFLQRRNLVEARIYPVFTLLGQSLGSMVLGLEAILKFVPTIYIDTMGYAFTLPLFKFLGNCEVACYVHYPTISTDMLQRVSQRTVAHNNRAVISRSPLLTSAKLFYYRSFAYIYGMCGRCADAVMVNSSWTKGHIVDLWKVPGHTFMVYPPCDIAEFKSISHDEETATAKEFRVLSIAQFRPEKDHALQLKVIAELKGTLEVPEFARVKLVLVGSCRNKGDEDRVNSLREMTSQLGLTENVEFKINIPFGDLKSEMSRASAGIHTMWNEHFGIGVVECMAAGLLMVAHDSGGPKMDIVTMYDGQQTGFLASDIQSYTNVFKTLLKMTAPEKSSICANARKSSERFSDEVFTKSFLDVMKPAVLKVIP